MESKPVDYRTLSEAIKGSKRRGYNLDFDVSPSGRLVAVDHNNSFSQDEVRIDEVHRFEGMSNPSDTSILYLLSTYLGAKGTMVDSYGAEGSELKSKFLQGAVQRTEL